MHFNLILPVFLSLGYTTNGAAVVDRELPEFDPLGHLEPIQAEHDSVSIRPPEFLSSSQIGVPPPPTNSSLTDMGKSQLNGTLIGYKEDDPFASLGLLNFHWLPQAPNNNQPRPLQRPATNMQFRNQLQLAMLMDHMDDELELSKNPLQRWD